MSAAQGTDAWLQERCGIATASMFSAVLATIKSGEAAERRNYRVQLVVERLTGKPTEQGFISQDMKHGIEREPIARMLYESRTGNLVEEVGLVRHASLECGASPDGLIDEFGGLEVKCPAPSAHFDYLRLAPFTCPSKYVAQIQGAMLVTGRQWWDFCSFNPDYPEASSLVIRRIARDERYIANLEAEITKFMNEVRADEEFARNYQEPK